jgi:hypothetical protein
MSGQPSYLVADADAVTLVNVAEAPPPRWLLMYVVGGEGVPRYLGDGDLPADLDGADRAAVVGQIGSTLAAYYALSSMDPTGEEAAAWILRPLAPGSR